MGRLNEMLGSAAGFSRGLAAMLGLQEQEGVPTVAPELVPTTDIFMRPEQWALHGGSLLWGRNAIAAGGAANMTYSSIEPGEGELVIVESLIPPITGADHYLTLSFTPLTQLTGNLVARDVRRISTTGGSASSGTRMSSKNDAPTAGDASLVAYIPTTAGAVPPQIELNCVLVKPWCLRLRTVSLNVAIGEHTWFVRARPATPRELAVFGGQSIGGL